MRNLYSVKYLIQEADRLEKEESEMIFANFVKEFIEINPYVGNRIVRIDIGNQVSTPLFGLLPEVKITLKDKK